MFLDAFAGFEPTVAQGILPPHSAFAAQLLAVGHCVLCQQSSPRRQTNRWQPLLHSPAKSPVPEGG